MLEDSTFWALIGLIIFFVIIFAVGAPRLATRKLDERTERIRNELEEARKSREEAQALLAEYQRKRREAEAEAENIVEEARREAKRMSDEANAKLNEMIERRTKSAEDKIALAEAQATSEIRGHASDLAVQAASHILSERLSGDASQQMIDEGIATVRERLH